MAEAMQAVLSFPDVGTAYLTLRRRDAATWISLGMGDHVRVNHLLLLGGLECTEKHGCELLMTH